MKKLLVSVLALCALGAAACGDNVAPTKLGAAGPTSPTGHFTVTADPSVPDGGGQNATIGSTAMLTDGLHSWVKAGSADTDWMVYPTGNFTAVTPIVDMTATQSGISFTPKLQRAGYYFVLAGGAMVFTSYAGTATSSAVWGVGNDATFINVVQATTMTSSNLNIFGPFFPIDASNAGPGNPSTLVDAATEIKFKSTTAVTGVTAFTARYIVNGFWIPKT